MKVTVNNIEFKSKKDLEIFVRQLLNDARGNLDGIFEIRGRELQFMGELFKRHPDYLNKCGCGINKVFVGGDAFNKKYAFVFIQRTDGTEIDISWKICVSGKTKTLHNIQCEIMRRSIANQILDFRDKCNINCNGCGKPSLAYDVDHYNIEFKQLVDQFKAKNKLPIYFQELKSGGHQFRAEDFKVEAKWKQFHLDNAKLQKLCKACHKQKTYKRANNVIFT